ncbi:MAG: 7-cyano-7-deazaguanine synthase QueC [Candidatus Omnitrophica bacterium]|nr:7-cyano-7-deazaguanine synthase QueC [Candidatus Omnitrophota bacterium]
MRKAICLLSGGIDSTTTLYVALHDRYDVHALTIDYGQLHAKEVSCAREIAKNLGIVHYVLPISLPWKGSALLDDQIPIPKGRDRSQMAESIPSTYVPVRNTIFLSLAMSWAEAEGADVVFFGANVQDYSGYPDCRPEYLAAFTRMIWLGTKAGREGGKLISIETPLVQLSKKAIIQLGQTLKVPFEKTWSCYQGLEMPCGECDSCRIRAHGFQEAGMEDPLMQHAVASVG